MVPSMVTFILAILASSVSAQLAATTPQCGQTCFSTKVAEAGQLGLAQTDINGLCSSEQFVSAWNQCLQDNCVTPEDMQGSGDAAAQVCASASSNVASASSSVGSLVESASSSASTEGASLTSAIESAQSDAASASSEAATATASDAQASASSVISSVSSQITSLQSDAKSSATSAAASLTSKIASATSAAGAAATSALGSNGVIKTSVGGATVLIGVLSALLRF